MDILSLTEKPQTDKLSICRFDKWWIDCKKDGGRNRVETVLLRITLSEKWFFNVVHGSFEYEISYHCLYTLCMLCE